MRAGDTVKHIPSGETWSVAYAERGDIAPCGWPDSLAREDDCVLVKAATYEEHRKMLETWANKKERDRRRIVCERQLKELINKDPRKWTWIYGCGGFHEVIMDKVDGKFTGGYMCPTVGYGATVNPTTLFDYAPEGFYNTKKEAIEGFLAKAKKLLAEYVIVDDYLRQTLDAHTEKMNNVRQNIAQYTELLNKENEQCVN